MGEDFATDTSNPDKVNSDEGGGEGDVVGATGKDFGTQLAEFEATYDRITGEAREFQVLQADLKNIKKIADANI